MQFQGAVIKEQGVTFAIVIVKSHILNDQAEADQLIGTFQQLVFGGIPVVLMAQNSRGTPTYYGRPDIADFMSRVPLQVIPWKQYSVG
ncbi:MAG: hypothetical protein HZC41_09640 [Chloroflexi bacterium]|nr:hypothetical protein [Chloroflexota bacterium]